MTRPEFLSRPGVWLRTGSRLADPVRDAYAIERHRDSKPTRTEQAASVLLAVIIGITGAAMLVHWAAS